MSNITLDQLRAGITLQCELITEEDGITGTLQVVSYANKEDPEVVVFMPLNLAILHSHEESVIEEIQTQLCKWLDSEGFADYSFVLGMSSNNGSFIIKLDPEAHP